MITLVLVPGSGEGDIKAESWSLKGRSSITGTWSKGENGIIQVTFKMSFHDAGYHGPIFVNGHFDPERNSLTDVWGYSAELGGAKWMTEFRRIPSHYLTVYPNIRELSDSKPRALWRFAITAVRNDIRRDHWSWSYFSQRRDDRKSIIPLLLRIFYFGPDLSDEEERAFLATTQRLTPADCCFYESNARYIRANARVHL